MKRIKLGKINLNKNSSYYNKLIRIVRQKHLITSLNRWNFKTSINILWEIDNTMNG